MTSRTYEEFIDGAVAHAMAVRGLRGDVAAFLSGETIEDALRRWWGSVLLLAVVGPGEFEWTCPGCGDRLASADDALYAAPMFDYVMWERCPTCSSAMGG